MKRKTGLILALAAALVVALAGIVTDENECFYGLRIASFLTLKADMQLIRHPGGQAARSDVLVGTLRLETTF